MSASERGDFLTPIPLTFSGLSHSTLRGSKKRSGGGSSLGAEQRPRAPATPPCQSGGHRRRRAGRGTAERGWRRPADTTIACGHPLGSWTTTLPADTGITPRHCHRPLTAFARPARDSRKPSFLLPGAREPRGQSGAKHCCVKGKKVSLSVLVAQNGGSWSFRNSFFAMDE